MASKKASRRVVLLRFAYSMSVNVCCTILSLPHRVMSVSIVIFRGRVAQHKNLSVIPQIVSDLLMRSPDDPVYNFMDKKRAEGKPYYVYMTAGANKFLRIYYGRVKEYLPRLSKEQE